MARRACGQRRRRRRRSGVQCRHESLRKSIVSSIDVGFLSLRSQQNWKETWQILIPRFFFFPLCSLSLGSIFGERLGRLIREKKNSPIPRGCAQETRLLLRVFQHSVPSATSDQHYANELLSSTAFSNDSNVWNRCDYQKKTGKERHRRYITRFKRIDIIQGDGIKWRKSAREREREKDSECLLGRRKGDKETPSDITGQRSSRVGLKVLRSDRLVFWPPSSSSLLLTLLSSNRGIRSGLTPRLQPVIRTNLWLKLFFFFFFFYLFCWRRQCVASIYSPPCPTIPLHH